MLHHVEAVPAHTQPAKGILPWVTANRMWLIPFLSAVFVVTIEVYAGLAGRTLPMEAHGVLVAFWIFSVGRTADMEMTTRRRSRRIANIARRQHLPSRVVRDEYDLLEALIEQRSLERGDDDGR